MEKHNLSPILKFKSITHLFTFKFSFSRMVREEREIIKHFDPTLYFSDKSTMHISLSLLKIHIYNVASPTQSLTNSFVLLLSLSHLLDFLLP